MKTIKRESDGRIALTIPSKAAAMRQQEAMERRLKAQQAAFNSAVAAGKRARRLLIGC